MVVRAPGGLVLLFFCAGSPHELLLPRGFIIYYYSFFCLECPGVVTCFVRGKKSFRGVEDTVGGEEENRVQGKRVCSVFREWRVTRRTARLYVKKARQC